MRKILILVAKLVDESSERSNSDLEAEITSELSQIPALIPYVATVEKVTVLDCPT